ncbi:MAG: competence/damage-inducible protein A [Alphaproteobacteria bacterium]
MQSEATEKVVTAALIIIGNEILSGRTQDTNTSYIALKLAEKGIRLREVRVIPDTEEHIIETLNKLRTRYDYVFTTGGIGPTHDDITAESVAKAFGVELPINDEAFRILEQYYGIEKLTPARTKMARIPVGATLIPNSVSAAPGFVIGNVHVMAGVPRIMQAMLDHILGGLQSGAAVLTASLACGLAESDLAEEVGMLQSEHPDIEIGSYPQFRVGVLGLSIVMRSTVKESIETAMNKLILIVRNHGDEPMVSYQFSE